MSAADSKVECQSCGRQAQPNFAKCLREGWPECCGSTMMLLGTQANIEHAVGEAVGEGLKGAKHLLEMLGNTQEKM